MTKFAPDKEICCILTICCITTVLSAKHSNKFAFMLRRILYTLLLAIGFGNFSNAQDTLYDKKHRPLTYDNFVRDSAFAVRVKVVRPQFRFDNRNVYFKGQMLALGGYDAGVMLADRLRVTVGYYRTNQNLSSYHKEVGTTQYNRKLNLTYFSLNTEFTYINKRFFSLGMPLEFGFGKNTSRYNPTPTSTVEYKQDGFVLVADFGLSLTFKPIRWIGIRGVVGYRKNIVNQVQDFRFDGLITSVGLNIDFREITKDFRLFKLKKRYHRLENNSRITTMVNLIVD